MNSCVQGRFAKLESGKYLITPIWPVRGMLCKLNRRYIHGRRTIASNARTTLAKEVWPMAKVLIVDDNAFVRHAVCELFKREPDFEVCGEAENGKEAIEKAWELHPDLIVLDLAMPVMNGLDAAGVLKCLMPTVVLIMYSAFADNATKQEILRKGISELVSKSESFDVLVGRARRVLYPRAA